MECEAGFLVVEDDAGVARYVARTLRHLRPVHVAATAAEARRVLEEPRAWAGWIFDVYLDLASADTGLDLLAFGRKRYVDVPAVVLTGQHDAAITARAFALDAGYLDKPVDLENLRRFAYRALARRTLASPRVATAVAALAERYCLSGREVDLLVHAIRQTPRVDLERAWQVSPTTLKTETARLLEKLDTTSLKDAAIETLREALGED